ncbi:sialidase family protein [Streptomyces sp. NPDC048277]|uniref:sialidase family protein n=1 Tax=Streptomyces sp. NPDC048277 TaxID=3155027 RepID=UPI00340160B4
MPDISPSVLREGKLRVAGAIVALALALTVSLGTAQAQASNHRSGSAVLQVDVTNSTDLANGQPVVAVNPRNHDDMVYVSTDDVATGTTLEHYGCYVAHSGDGGRTWTKEAWPYGDSPQCGDPYLAVDSHGIFYLSFNELGCPDDPTGPPHGTCGGVANPVGVARSLDGGRTWSDPVGTTAARGATPRLRVDSATGYVYVVGGAGNPVPSALAVSEDHGLTWSPITPLPDQPFGNQIAVHNGVLATATAMKIVGGTSVVATEVNFDVSFDQGRTFSSFPVTDSRGAAVAPPEGPSLPNNVTFSATDPVPWVTADPTRTGRFALMIPRGDTFEVYVTGDAGRSWTGPAVIAAPGAVKPWIEYGPTGQLGVMWRTISAGRTDVYSTVSFDRGKSFGRVLKLNRASLGYGFLPSGGDEWSRILLTGDYAYVTWSGSATDGGIDGIVDRVPLSLYR